MRYYDSRDPYEKPSPLGRFGSWIGRRPFESWGFFIAGFLIARILFCSSSSSAHKTTNKKTKPREG